MDNILAASSGIVMTHIFYTLGSAALALLVVLLLIALIMAAVLVATLIVRVIRDTWGHRKK